MLLTISDMFIFIVIRMLIKKVLLFSFLFTNGCMSMHESFINVKQSFDNLHYDKFVYYNALKESDVYTGKFLKEVEHDGYIEEEHKFILFKSIQNGWIHTLKYMIYKGADVNTHESILPLHSLLHYAVEYNQLPIAKYLISEGADVNSDSRWHTRPIHIASYKGNVEMLKLLIENSADINADDEFLGFRMKPIHYAVEAGFEDIVKILIKKNPLCINCPTDSLDTPLHIAINNGHVNIVKILIDSGSNINAQLGGIECYTPLHCAVEKGNLEIVELLLSYNADVNIKDRKGRTSLDLVNFILDLSNNNVLPVILNIDSMVESSDTPQYATVPHPKSLEKFSNETCFKRGLLLSITEERKFKYQAIKDLLQQKLN